jgi:hypothetical protein
LSSFWAFREEKSKVVAEKREQGNRKNQISSEKRNKRRL